MWGLLGQNAGQIQILLAILALILALLGYFGLMKQIRFSKDQDTISLKLKALELLALNIEKHSKVINTIDLNMYDFEELVKLSKEKNHIDTENLEEHLVLFKTTRENSSNTRSKLKGFLKEINESSDQLDPKFLGDLYRVLSNASNSAELSDLIKPMIVRYQKEKNLS